MFRRIKRWHAWMCAAMTMAAVSCPGQVFAEENKALVTIPVTVEVTGEGADGSEDFQVVMEGNSADTPMPEQSVLRVKRGESAGFGPMEYMTPGDYFYTISQKAGATANMTYDTARYAVTVRVVNGENGGLTAEVWAVRDGSEEKEAALVFHNEYVRETEPQTEPETETETEIQTEPETEPETETETEAETEIQTDTETETETRTKIETEKDTEAQTGKDTKATPSANPKTGDNTPIARWIGLMAAALAVIVALAVIIKKKRTEK